MKTLLLTLTYVVGAGELILAIYFWATNSKSEVRKVLSLLSLSTGLWVTWSAIINTNDGILVNRVIYFFGALMVAALFHFICIYPYPLYRFDRFHAWLFYLPTLLFMLLAVSGKTIVEGITVVNGVHGYPVGGSAFILYNLFLFIEYLSVIAILFLRRKGLEGTYFRNTNIILTSIIVGGLPAVYIDLFATVSGTPFTSFLYANLFTGVWLGGMIYILRKS